MSRKYIYIFKHFCQHVKKVSKIPEHIMFKMVSLTNYSTRVCLIMVRKKLVIKYVKKFKKKKSQKGHFSFVLLIYMRVKLFDFYFK